MIVRVTTVRRWRYALWFFRVCAEHVRVGDDTRTYCKLFWG